MIKVIGYYLIVAIASGKNPDSGVAIPDVQLHKYFSSKTECSEAWDLIMKESIGNVRAACIPNIKVNE